MERGKISVCMAVYNGRRFIREQLVSILRELSELDEVIVVDDASRDNSVEIVKSFNDSRIKIVELGNNVGHVRAFEVALGMATGDYVFLSDQDDVWVEGKVEVILNYFEQDKSVCYIYHNIYTIDANGKFVQTNISMHKTTKFPSFAFIAKHMIKPEIFGCGSAFKRRVVELALPFPPGVYAHEHWIALVSALVGNVQFVEDCLLNYRRHGGNLSPSRHGKWIHVLKRRMVLFGHFVLAVARFGCRKVGEN